MRLIAIALIALALSSCGVVDTVADGFKHSQEVSSDLESTVGSKPQVGFNWANGVLVSVNVTFDRVPPGKSAEQIAALVQSSVTKHFAQKPKHLILGFDLADE